LKNIILKTVEFIAFFSIIIILGFIGYWQASQFEKLENIERQLQKANIKLIPKTLNPKKDDSVKQTPKEDIYTILLNQIVAEHKKNKEEINDLKEILLTVKEELKFKSIKLPIIIDKTAITPSSKQNDKSEELDLLSKLPNKSPNKSPNKVRDTKNTNEPELQNQLHSELDQKLKKCKKYLNNYRLTNNKNGNAHDCYLSILTNEPQNTQALDGIKAIEASYVRSINKYIVKGKLSKSKLFLKRLQKVNPNNNQITELEDKLKTAATASKVNASSKATTKAKLKPKLKAKSKAKQLAFNNDFIKISPGCFTQDKKQLCIEKNYSIGKFEVTQQQWLEIMGKNPSRFQACGSDCPVENVSWFDVQEFIRKLNKDTGKNYRLPTQTEWEYATRAGSTAQYYFGDNKAELADYANYCDKNCSNDWKNTDADDGAKTTTRVGSYKPNSWGLYDTLGNVWEWVETKNSDKQSYHGGSWGDSYKLCSSSSSGDAKPDFHVSGIGFRLVSDQ
jgi:formylglycine-generating enzyme required for sulfatase activity